jgi:hypothetical protein
VVDSTAVAAVDSTAAVVDSTAAVVTSCRAARISGHGHVHYHPPLRCRAELGNRPSARSPAASVRLPWDCRIVGAGSRFTQLYQAATPSQ